MSYNSGGSGSKGFGFAGFTMPKRNPSNVSLHAVPPPASTMHTVPPPAAGLSKQGYHTMSSITQNAVTGNWGSLGKKRSKTEDEYFDDDDEPVTPALAYIPAPGSPSNEVASSSKQEEEEDPLDAYMAGLEQQAAKDMVTSKENAVTGKGDGARGTRGDIDDMDDEESYYKYMEDNPLHNGDDASDIEIEYDEDGNPLAPPKKKFIDPLPPIDHSEIVYEPFEKNFYTPHEDIEQLTFQQVEELKKNLGVKISGPDPPRPVSSFAHLGFDEQLLKAIRRSEYSQPTPVQAAGVPAALSGRDLIGIARTGSGKTAAFLWPLLIHIMDQKELKPGEGPIGLILAPTRELAQQIYMEAKKFGKVYNIRCVCCYGRGSKWEQTKALEEMESRARATGQQFSTHLEFMESHGDLAKPQPGAQGRLRADTLWQELSVILNSIGGGVNKTPDKWKKVWADWKSKTKKKSLTIRRHASGTGGGPSSTLTLSTLETRVLAIIGELAVEGHPEIEEQGFNRPPDELIAPAEPHLLDINVGLEDGQPISLILAGPSEPVSIQSVSWQQEPPPPALTPLAANLPAPAAPPRSTSRQAEALSPLFSYFTSSPAIGGA